MINQLKKIICIIVVFVMALSLPLSKPSIDIIYAKEEIKQLYSKDGITINFKVISQWEKAFEGQLIVTNQSDAPLENWKMEFEFDHKITSIWDGEIESNQGKKYVIKYPLWNGKIPKDGKTVIGFIASSSDQITEPKNCKLLTSKSEIQAEDYTISYRNTSDWGDAFNAEITILNNTNKAIEGWTLEFDFDKTIKQIWNAKVLDQNEGHYTVRNDEWNSIIKPKEKVSFGFEGHQGNTSSEPQNFKLIASDGVGSDVTDEAEQDVRTDTKKDTDQDGLPDYIEHGMTDINNPDTDGDGLNDYYEYIIIRTDPTLKDTDGNGIADDKEDLDQDGLDNSEELKLGTEPLISDTDEDGLTDSEEVLKHKTDPLKKDTDGDQILDSDEIVIGLDPNNPYTHDGTKDSEYKIWQDAAVEYLKEINSQNDYEVSLRLYVAGNANNLPVKTNYQEALSSNRAVIGTPINFYYKESAMEKGEIQYKLKSSLLEEQIPLLSDTKLGLKRYSIFRLDEKSNILYPIPVEYDATNQTIKAEFDNSGVFCLVDLECLVYDLGLEREKKGKVANKVQDTIPKLERKDLKQMFKSDSEIYLTKQRKKRNADKQIDLVLAVDSTGSMHSYINSVKENLIYLLRDLRNEGISLYVSVIDYKDIVFDGEDSTKVNDPKNVDFLNNPDDIIKVLDKIKIGGGGSDGSETALDALGAAANLKYRKNADKYVFLITSAGYKNDNSYNIKNMDEMITLLKEKGITTSVVSEYKDKEKYGKLSDSTQGIWINLIGRFYEDIYKMLIQNKKDSFYGVLGTDLSIISLNKVPTQNSKTDTDRDELPDSKEIVWDNIATQDGTPKLPTIEELLKSKFDMDTSKLAPIMYMDNILKLKVIPVTSNPAEIDSDGDYYKDKDDKLPFCSDPMSILDDQIDDADVFDPTNEPDSPQARDFTLPSVTEIVDSKIIYDDPNISKKPSVEYYRKTKSEADGRSFQFTIKPKNNSDYKFTILKFPSVKEQTLKVEEERFFLFNLYYDLIKPYQKVELNSDGSKTHYYSLMAGKTYVITVRCDSWAKDVQKYTFKAEQDNWVKVGEHGGVWTNTSNRKGIGLYPKKLYYIDKDTGYYIGYLKFDKEVRADISGFIENGIAFTFPLVIDYIKKVAKGNLGQIINKATPFLTWAATTHSIYDFTKDFLAASNKQDYISAMKDGEGIIYGQFIDPTIANISLWDPWPKKSVKFINKYTLSYRGTIAKGFTQKDVDELFK